MQQPSEQLAFAPLGSRVLISHNGEPIGTIGWKAAKVSAIELKSLAQTSAAERVGYVLHTDGRPIGLDVDRVLAGRIAAALHQTGAFAEENDNRRAQEVVMDNALLLRLGVPIGLSDNPTIQAESAKEAAWNTALRRSIPGGVRSQSVAGTPTLQSHDPKRTLQ